MNWIRAFLCPTIFALIVSLNAIFPSRLHQFLPKLWPIPDSQNLPHYTISARPRSILTAFQLGRIFQRLQSLQTPSHPDEEQLENQQQTLLLHARPLVHGTLASISDLNNLESHLKLLDTRLSIVDRLRAAISIVNALWLVSILGLLVTLGPTLAFLGGKVARIAWKWFVDNVLPVLIRMHHLGVFEALSYFICVLFLAQATRYMFAVGPGSPGSYVALTTAVLSFVAFRYTAYLHVWRHIPRDNLFRATEADYIVVNSASHFFQLAVFAPLAITHKSELLGFGAVWKMLSSIGLIAGTMPSGYFFGFQTEREMDRVALSSLFLVLVFVIGRVIGFGHLDILRPFHFGVMVLGNFGYFLALLIRTSLTYHENKFSVMMQAQMIVSLLFALAVGRFFRIESMNSTASTFAVLYVVTQLGQLPFEHWQIVGWFLASCVLYAAALFLRTNPKYLATLVDPRGLLRS